MPRKGVEGRPDSIPSQRCGKVCELPIRQSLLRITSTINEKEKQFNKWLEKGKCKSDEAFVIAINGKNLELRIHSDKHKRPPDIFQAVYPVEEKVFFDRSTRNWELAFCYKKELSKDSGAVVEKNFFQDANRTLISGILFTIDWLGRGYCINTPLYTYIPNLYAKNPLDPEILGKLSNFSQVWDINEYGNKIATMLRHRNQE